MLEARHVSVTAGGNFLLKGVGVAARPGRIVALIGPNGAGKSTLLRVLSGELMPTHGGALLDGRPLAAFSAAELARRRAVVPQASALAFPFTVLEVAMLGITVPGLSPTTSAARAAGIEALAAVGLSALADRLYVHLSGGERQRTHIARALCQIAASAARADQTRCLLLDEPTSNLDLAHQSLVLEAVRRQASGGNSRARRDARPQPRRGACRRAGAAGGRRNQGFGPSPPGPARRPAVGGLRLPRIHQPHPRRRPPVRAAAGRVLCPALPPQSGSWRTHRTRCRPPPPPDR